MRTEAGGGNFHPDRIDKTGHQQHRTGHHLIVRGTQMPHVYNGIGTWYYGKRNVQRRPVCGLQVGFRSHILRHALFFVVVFVPLIPLRKLHIVDQCAGASASGAIPWGDWERAQKRMQEAMEAYRKSPTNAQLAEEVIRLVVPYRDVTTFLDIAPEIEKTPGAAPRRWG